MEKEKTAQQRATESWAKNNPEKMRYKRKKSAAKTFLLKDIKDEDLEQFIGYLEELKNRK